MATNFSRFVKRCSSAFICVNFANNNCGLNLKKSCIIVYRAIPNYSAHLGNQIFHTMKKIKILKSLLPLFLFCLGTILCRAQKKYSYKISFFGDHIDRKNLDVSFSQGYFTKSIPIDTSNNILQNDTSLLKYPSIQIFYFSPKHAPAVFLFFLIKQNSELNILYDSLTDVVQIKNSEGMVNAEKAGKNKFDTYAKKEEAKIDSFSKKYNYDFTTASPDVMKQFHIYTDTLRGKQLEFVKKFPKAVYSMWLFMNEVIQNRNYPKEYLVSVYNKYLKPTYKNSFEERYLFRKLDTKRLEINTEAPFQSISFKDLQGSKHTIQSFGGKPVLINIWATWCIPCVAEMPKLKSLYAHYKDDLTMISFSADVNEIKLRDYISINNIDWINVFNRFDFCNMYGADKGIPQLYLLDKNGLIIYSRAQTNDIDLNELTKLLKQLSKTNYTEN